MKIEKNLELVAVEYNNENGSDKAELVFLNEEAGEVRRVTLQRSGYDNEAKKFVPDLEKAGKVNGYVKEVFGTTFEDLTNQIGVKKDVYIYGDFNHIVEFNIPKKFELNQVGEIMTGKIISITDNERLNKIEFIYDVDGDEYMSNMGYSVRVNIDSKMKLFKDPDKKKRQLNNFKNKFHVPFSEKDSLIGKTVMVEVKSVNGNVFGEMKAMKKPK
ncbi:hypothetical protein [Eremococcus coleocola]|uniref:hypothetical protein n=1 Tax=Eremococcus coleocola TaxID=88132 RepID=UPI0003F8B5E8|nr:hypothetical protein [Eremococcus coleocola]